MPDVFLQLPEHVRFFLQSLCLSRVLREKLLGAKRSGDLADQVMSPKYELKCPEKLALNQSIDSCCVCCGYFLVEQSTSPTSESVSHVSSIVRLQSLYIFLFDMPGKSTCDVSFNK